MAGGRDESGAWRSEKTARFMQGLCVKVAMAITYARTGDPTPLPLRPEPSATPTIEEQQSKSGPGEDADDDTVAVHPRDIDYTKFTGSWKHGLDCTKNRELEIKS